MSHYDPEILDEYAVDIRTRPGGTDIPAWLAILIAGGMIAAFGETAVFIHAHGLDAPFWLAFVLTVMVGIVSASRSDDGR